MNQELSQTPSEEVLGKFLIHSESLEIGLKYKNSQPFEHRMHSQKDFSETDPTVEDSQNLKKKDFTLFVGGFPTRTTDRKGVTNICLISKRTSATISRSTPPSTTSPFRETATGGRGASDTSSSRA